MLTSTIHCRAASDVLVNMLFAPVSYVGGLCLLHSFGCLLFTVLLSVAHWRCFRRTVVKQDHFWQTPDVICCLDESPLSNCRPPRGYLNAVLDPADKIEPPVKPHQPEKQDQKQVGRIECRLSVTLHCCNRLLFEFRLIEAVPRCVVGGEHCNIPVV